MGRMAELAIGDGAGGTAALALYDRTPVRHGVDGFTPAQTIMQHVSKCRLIADTGRGRPAPTPGPGAAGRGTEGPTRGLLPRMGGGRVSHRGTAAVAGAGPPRLARVSTGTRPCPAVGRTPASPLG
jgi:hypothetical protein